MKLLYTNKHTQLSHGFVLVVIIYLVLFAAHVVEK